MPTRAPTHKPPWWNAKARAARERKRKRDFNKRRGSTDERGYDRDWRELRDRFIRAYPACSQPGCTRPATDVDHRVSIALRPDLRLDWYNLRSFCHPHHSRHTALTQGFARPR